LAGASRARRPHRSRGCSRARREARCPSLEAATTPSAATPPKPTTRTRSSCARSRTTPRVWTGSGETATRLTGTTRSVHAAGVSAISLGCAAAQRKAGQYATADPVHPSCLRVMGPEGMVVDQLARLILRRCRLRAVQSQSRVLRSSTGISPGSYGVPACRSMPFGWV
jgi:hypothetical protein